MVGSFFFTFQRDFISSDVRLGHYRFRPVVSFTSFRGTNSACTISDLVPLLNSRFPVVIPDSKSLLLSEYNHFILSAHTGYT